MKIVVAIKQVPARDSQLRIDASASGFRKPISAYEINEPDAYALEAALQLKEKHGGEVVALCAGPARAAQTIREALAKGADRAIHIEDDNLERTRSAGDRTPAGHGCRAEKPDLILTGLQSDDLGLRPDRRRSWPNCWACRTPPSSWRWRRRTAASG